MLDAPTSSMIADLNYAIMPRWRLSLAATMQRFTLGRYYDYEIGLGRSIGRRRKPLRSLFCALFGSHRLWADYRD